MGLKSGPVLLLLLNFNLAFFGLFRFLSEWLVTFFVDLEKKSPTLSCTNVNAWMKWICLAKFTQLDLRIWSVCKWTVDCGPILMEPKDFSTKGKFQSYFCFQPFRWWNWFFASVIYLNFILPCCRSPRDIVFDNACLWSIWKSKTGYHSCHQGKSTSNTETRPRLAGRN